MNYIKLCSLQTLVFVFLTCLFFVNLVHTKNKQEHNKGLSTMPEGVGKYFRDNSVNAEKEPDKEDVKPVSFPKPEISDHDYEHELKNQSSIGIFPSLLNISFE